MSSKQLIELSIVIGLCAVLYSCSTSRNIAIRPADVLSRDVFTCKGLTADKRWVGITDQFLPEEDDKVVVVARFSPEDQTKYLIYELTNPLRTVVTTDKVKYPNENILGIFYDMDRLMKLGGEGEWRATIFADHEPLGQAVFYLGEKPEETEEEAGPSFVFVGEESSEEETALPPESERFGSYIQEVTPELSIPSADGIQTAPPEISPATP